MSYGSAKRSESSASRRSMDGDTTEDGTERDESKRRSRNLSEKKRRDQFNVLINELCAMVSTSPRKMDKSTTLKATISFLKAHNELSVQSQVRETQEDWKPSFLSNEEFTHLMLEALDGFIIVISSSGIILYLSESITSLLGYLSTDLVSGNTTIYDYILPEERNKLFEILANPGEDKCKGQVSTTLNFRVGGLETTDESDQYQLVKLVGHFRRWISPSECGAKVISEKPTVELSETSNIAGNGSVLIATGRLIVCDLLREMSVVVDSEKNEFASRHSLEWKFLFLDHRAPPIIGYLPFEVLGTSGYDYYHVEDLDKVATCHETLMSRGEGTSCCYRFLTKGQQWIWLQTRFYITYHQWNSKPEFIVCTHRVVSYADVLKDTRGEGSLSPFQDLSPVPKLGPTVPKQPKVEFTKGLRSSSRLKNGNQSYGSIGSRRNSGVQKLDLPPKFVPSSSDTTSHPQLEPPLPPLLPTPTIPQITTLKNSLPSSNIANTINTMPAQAFQPQAPQQAQAPPTTANMQGPPESPTVVPAVTYGSMTQNPSFEIASPPPIQTSPPQQAPPLAQDHSVSTSSSCILQEQLLRKHAELQRQIIEQQEELRRVSEQLLLTQCGWIQNDSVPLAASPLAPMHHDPSEEDCIVQLQPVQGRSTALMTYSSHPAPPPPANSINQAEDLS